MNDSRTTTKQERLSEPVTHDARGVAEEKFSSETEIPCKGRKKTGSKSELPLKKPKRTRRIVRRCNFLTGKQWIQNSISVWSDIRKMAIDQTGQHPAIFPIALLERLIETFLPVGGEKILDPFCGSGSTLLAAGMKNKTAIGLELSAEYCEETLQRLKSLSPEQRSRIVCHEARAQDLLEHTAPTSIDLCITSPPYWNVLNRPRSADNKAQRNYGNLDGDLGLIDRYEDYLEMLSSIFQQVYQALKPGCFCIVVVMDLRKGKQFYPLHSDLSGKMTDLGFIFDDLIIWNRQYDYNNLRPLGFPAVFRVNKVHEYILLFQKPHQQETSTS
ncbi:MAG: site-specific DNA-methyltransferase [Planctomycetaceae bacterium]|nr:site-specific DNA-methyltransferase [Planctomycetaceae bacterium]